jgi:hypothetical protein
MIESTSALSGCGGRMNTHIRYLATRAKEKGDIQLLAVNDIFDKRKREARKKRESMRNPSTTISMSCARARTSMS